MYALQQRFDGVFKQRAGQLGDQPRLKTAEVDGAGLLLGEGDLAVFHLHGQPVTITALDQLE